MYAGRRPTAERRTFERSIDALLVHRVSCFVQRAEQRVGKIVFLDTRRDTHVAQRKLRHERMVSLVLAAPSEVVSETFDHAASERELMVLRRAAFEARIIGWWICGDRLHDGDESGA